MLDCILPAKKFPPKTANEKKYLSTQSLIFILTKNKRKLIKLTNTIQHFYIEDKNKQIHSQIKNNHTTDKDKNNQIHWHIKIHLNNINKNDKYK